MKLGTREVSIVGAGSVVFRRFSLAAFASDGLSLNSLMRFSSGLRGSLESDARSSPPLGIRKLAPEP